MHEIILAFRTKIVNYNPFNIYGSSWSESFGKFLPCLRRLNLIGSSIIIVIVIIDIFCKYYHGREPF